MRTANLFEARGEGAFLQEGWVLANHILVSFHVAFISSVLAIPADATTRAEVLRFIFASPETIVSALFTLACFHAGIALHELGHFLEAARLRALNESIQQEVNARLAAPLGSRLAFLLGLFARIPYGRALGVKREGLNYYPDAPYNLAVAAAGPRASRNVALAVLPPAALLLALGLAFEAPAALYPGRLLLGLGVVCLLDFFIADAGKYRELRERERRASQAAASLPEPTDWDELAPEALRRLGQSRMHEVVHPRLGAVCAPWQFRNCGMGGRHTEREYPESNISMQEAMFLILGAADAQEAQEMTVRLQTRLKQILEQAEGCRVMGIGLEGGLAPYVDRGAYPLPEVRLWAMMKRAIEDCGLRPGVDVAIALDPALSELEIAYRRELDVPDSVGRYLFWRDRSKRVLDRDEVLAVYSQAIREYDIPILSIEDGFSEDDHEGWRLLVSELGERVLVIGDDLVTTNDATIEDAAARGLINAVLIKPNQIGTLYETLLAILVSLGKGLEVIVSHRSKSPNDDMEAHFALAANALGLKAGGGANTERLVKYQAVTTLMESAGEAGAGEPRSPTAAVVRRLRAREEPTNAGIPTVGTELAVDLPGAGVELSFCGATPLGTSAGTGEAVHKVDSSIERSEHRETVERHASLFSELEPGVVAFRGGLAAAEIESTGDEHLKALFARSRRYEGKGCLAAVQSVRQVLAPRFEGEDLITWDLARVDRELLRLELDTARRREKVPTDCTPEDALRVMQRKQNLGMNAVLSTSLALGRGLAHVQGRRLYELLREEMLAILARLAAEHEVELTGSRFEDYLGALREVNALLERRGEALHVALRRITGIYSGAAPAPAPPPAPDRRAPPMKTLVPAARPVEPFTPSESEELLALDRTLYEAWFREAPRELRATALRRYLVAMTSIGRRLHMFEIANHRLFRVEDALLVPYDAHGTLSLHVVRESGIEVLPSEANEHGTLVTDAAIAELFGKTGVEGDLEPVDLEPEIYHVDLDGLPEVRVARMRDLALLIERLNACGSRNEAVYLLRFLVARLCSSSFQGIPGAKNLQPEATRLRGQLAELMNGPFASRLRLPVRILVRNVAGMISRPKLIDTLWQDTIDLAEVHVRGSAITNELRRSAHHALGRRTLQLARAYDIWLRTGVADFPDPEREQPVSEDEAAREDPKARELTARIAATLEQLLGSSEIAGRLSEWRQAYSDDLLRCESTSTLEEEVAAFVERGIRPRNRWAYLHHLRSLERKAQEGRWPEDRRAALAERLTALRDSNPDAADFDPEDAERTAKDAVGEFAQALRAEHETPLFEALAALEARWQREEHLETFFECGRIRRALDRLGGGVGVFPSQRYLLHQLDCLLEELGYFALRHVASSFEEERFSLDVSLRVVHECADNLGSDGLFSRELWDLSCLLLEPGRTTAELLDALEEIQTNYHRVVHRVSVAYESMAERLGFGPKELRGVLANFQRTLHDLNSLVHFADLARQHLRDGTASAPTTDAGSDGSPGAAWDFVHLSHTEDVARRVEGGDDSALLDRFGGKGSGLVYAAYLGVPTRDAFAIPTTVGRLGLAEAEPERLEREVARHVGILEQDLARAGHRAPSLGDPRAPLLLAVRGGSVFSMPGMLSTIVFVGMTDAVAEALAREDPWYAWDCYRRFLVSWSAAAWQLDLESLDLVEDMKRAHGVGLKSDLDADVMREVVERTKSAIRAAGHGEELERLCEDAPLQVQDAVRAVLASWDRDRARRYRAIKGLADTWHTAVVVQEMASGNRSNVDLRPGLDERDISLTGVIPCTRMEATGFRSFTGDFKFSASGDDLVGGLTSSTSFQPFGQLGSFAPMLERRLRHIDARLRRFRGSDPELEFTVERGVLSVLQARSAAATRTTAASAFDDPGPPTGRGIGIRGGAFRGLVAFDETDVADLTSSAGKHTDADGVLLVIENPTPDEIPLLLQADALLTARGGSTSHAAVAVQSIQDRDYTAVLGMQNLRVRPGSREVTLVDEETGATRTVRRGEVLSLHGQTGAVYVGTRAVARVAEEELEGALPTEGESSDTLWSVRSPASSTRAGPIET